MKRTVFFILALTLLVAGCVEDRGGVQTSTQEPAVSQPTAEPADYSLDDADVPFIEENETVEIGEMI
ncbi:MAG: hypothetical protein V1744_03570 [Candidatus Altiarchaeota archaeon]